MRFMVQSLSRKRVVSSVAIVAAVLPAVGALASSALRAQAVATAPYYYYGVGPQGTGYYYSAVPVAQPAPAAAAPAAAPRITMPAQAPAPTSAVGPGVRNWATGNRLPLHRPWLRSR